jgi:hypothetical protein
MPIFTRNTGERFFNRIKHCRRVATRYDKLAANYLAFVQLASIRLWLRVNESTSSHVESKFAALGEALSRTQWREAGAERP